MKPGISVRSLRESACAFFHAEGFAASRCAEAHPVFLAQPFQIQRLFDYKERKEHREKQAAAWRTQRLCRKKRLMGARQSPPR